MKTSNPRATLIIVALALLSCSRKCLDDFDCRNCSEMEAKVESLAAEYDSASTYEAKVAADRKWRMAYDCLKSACPGR